MNNFEIGDKYFDVCNFRAAIEFYLEGLLANPEEVSSLENLCTAYFEIKAYDSSIGIADRILRLDPMNRIALECRAYSYHKLNRHSQAEIDFSMLIEMNPYDDFFYLYRSYVRRKLGKFNSAEKDLKMYELLSDKCTNIFFSIAENNKIEDRDLDEFNSTKKKCLAIISNDTQNYQAYFDLGVAYTKVLVFDKAIEAYSKAMELYPDKIYKEALFNRANAYFDNKEYLKCLEDIEIYTNEISTNSYLEELALLIAQKS